MPSHCPNCETPAHDRYCPHCGQPMRDPRGPLFGLIGDFFTEFLSLDGRHLRTAKALVHPGRLTRMYLEGKRASYVPPVRVYFVASLLFFLIVGLPAPDASQYNVYVNGILVEREAPEPGLSQMDIMNLDDGSWLGRKVAPHVLPKMERLQQMKAQDLLDDFFGDLERSIPAALILFVPILALAMTLLYVRQPFFYVDHLVFALHYQSFIFLAFVLANFANLAGLGRLWPGVLSYVAVFLVIAPTYLLVALRRVYGQSRGVTLVKAVLLGLMYVMVLAPVNLATAFWVILQM